jgi:hypothetical protein
MMGCHHLVVRDGNIVRHRAVAWGLSLPFRGHVQIKNGVIVGVARGAKYKF